MDHLDAEAWALGVLADPDARVEQIDSRPVVPARHIDKAVLRVEVRSQTGKADARQAAAQALDALLDKPKDSPGAGVADVRHVLGPVWSPLPDGQPAYSFAVEVWSRTTAAARVNPWGGNAVTDVTQPVKKEPSNG